ncbi:3-isopropylmalate dehydratase small subunit [candidate division KSB1 bacterium]|nr:3-isopropylmalate dehydratase small subunit [candidate division KSB1 bacterium]
MKPFIKITSRYVTLPVNDIDTDQIIPARYLKITDKAGLGDNCFYDWRYHSDGSPKEECILNREEAKKAEVLVAGDNFGCGSSREHAPWALSGYGFRAIISTGFADIFRSNALKNGLLPIVVDAGTLNTLIERGNPISADAVTIDLETQTLQLPHGKRILFDIDVFSKTCLLQGIDQLGYLLKYQDEISAYEAGHAARVDTRVS